MNTWNITANYLRDLSENEAARSERREIMARDEAYTDERDCAKIEQAVVVAFSAIMKGALKAAMAQKRHHNDHIEINLGAEFFPGQTMDTLFINLLERKLKREFNEAEVRFVEFLPKYNLHGTEYTLHFNFRIWW